MGSQYLLNSNLKLVALLSIGMLQRGEFLGAICPPSGTYRSADPQKSHDGYGDLQANRPSQKQTQAILAATPENQALWPRC
jgi:hypothetical protein